MRKHPLFEPPKPKRMTTNTKTPQATAFRHNRTRRVEAAPAARKPEPPETPPEPGAGERKPSTLTWTRGNGRR
jgi:hypothetical protein